MSVVIGEGGSGGAIAIATANRVYMLEHAIYSVISPEGAASILWRDTTRSKDAATNMKITAQDLLDLKIIDGIIPEPLGGAHRAPEAVVGATGDLIARTLANSRSPTSISASTAARNIWRWAAPLGSPESSRARRRSGFDNAGRAKDWSADCRLAAFRHKNAATGLMNCCLGSRDSR